VNEKTKWFEIKAASDQTRAQVYIFGAIVDFKWFDEDDDVTAKEFIDAVKTLGDFDLRINSPGGSVPAGNAIYNALRRHKGEVDVYVEGMALSMASVVAMAGSRVIMPANAMMMIHDPWSYAVGSAKQMRKAAETLDKFKSGLVAAYQAKTGMEPAEIERLMSEETWMTAADALEMGFADEIEEPVQMAAQFDLAHFRNVPKSLLKQAPRATGTHHRAKEKENIMDLKELQAKHPELFAQIQAAAREGMIAQADADTARTEAVAAENTRVMALVTAAVGEEPAKKISAAAAKGLTAEDLQTLGVSLAPVASGDSADEESRKQILAGLQGAAPEGLKPAAGKQGEAAERSAAAKAIAAGAGVR